MRKGIFAASAACATEMVLPESLVPISSVAAVADQTLGDDAAALGLGFRIAVDELHRRAAGLLDDLGAELVALAGLLAHEGLHAGEIENDPDLHGRRLRRQPVWQDGGAQRPCPAGQEWRRLTLARPDMARLDMVRSVMAKLPVLPSDYPIPLQRAC